MSTTESAPRGLRSRLPFDVEALTAAPIRRFFLGTLLGAFGSGTTYALFIVFCTHVRHFPIFVTSLMMGWEAILGLLLAPLFGTLVDRYGPSIVLTVTLPLVSVGIMSIGIAPTVPWMFLVATLIAAGGAGIWSAITVLITRIVVEAHRQDAFGVNFWLLNIGIGLGSIVGTSFVSLHSLRSFQVLYLVSGTLTLVDAALLFTLRRFGGPPPVPESHDTHQEGWRTVLQDRRMVRFVLASLLMMVCGYGSIEAGLPLFVTNVLHLKVHVIGLLIAFNTFTIIIAQLFVLHGIKGKSRSLLLASVGLLWGLSWLLAAGSLEVGAVAAVCFLCLGQVLFATGETIWQPASPAIVNDLAPEHLRGRYNAFVGIVWSVSSAVGALIAGAFFSLNAGRAWTLVLAGGALLGGVGMTTMRRVLSAAEDGRAVAATS